MARVAADDVAVERRAGEHDNGNMAPIVIRAQLLQRLRPVLAQHVDVEEDQVWQARFTGEVFDHRLPVSHKMHNDLGAGGQEGLFHEQGISLLILRVEDMDGFVVGRWHRHGHGGILAYSQSRV